MVKIQKCYNALSFASQCSGVCTTSSLHGLSGPFQSPETHHLYQSVDRQHTVYSVLHPWLLTCFGLEIQEVLPISMSIVFFTELEKWAFYCTK